MKNKEETDAYVLRLEEELEKMEEFINKGEEIQNNINEQWRIKKQTQITLNEKIKEVLMSIGHSID